MRPPPDFSSARPTRRLYPKAPDRSIDSRLVALFRSPITAFITLFAVSVVGTMPYVIAHMIPEWRPRPFDPRGAVSLASDGTFRPNFQEGKLERFYSKQQIADLEKRISDKAAALSEPALAARRDVMVRAGRLTRGSLLGSQPPFFLAEDPGKLSDAQVLRANLRSAALWLTNSLTGLPPEKRTDGALASGELIELFESEQNVRTGLREEISALDTPLSFGWLFIENGTWALEVLFWSFMGVHASSVIGLISACRRGEYSPSEFILLFPKILLAPLIAFVFVALWSTGISDSKISYLNLPYFLVFSFLLGFGTEGLYEKLRDLVALIVNPASTVSPQKLEDASRNASYAYRNPKAVPDSAAPPKTLGDLQKQLGAVLKGHLERSVITSIAIND